MQRGGLIVALAMVTRSVRHSSENLYQLRGRGVRSHGWRTILAAISCLGAASAFAADPDLPQAEQLIRDGHYAEAYELLTPFADTAKGDAKFDYLLGRAALGSNRADKAKALFEQSLAANPDSIAARLALGRAYYALGRYAEAKIQFETVLRFDNLPPDLLSQVETYVQAAEQYDRGRRLVGFGYVETGIGNYHVNSTVATTSGERDETFYNARVGGGLNYIFSNNWSLDGTLDYRYRYYDNSDSRDDQDVRWNAAASRAFGENNLALGFRGRVSYRGDGQWRNDYGVYADWLDRLNANNLLIVGGTVWRRQYPSGPLGDRSRSIAEISAGWVGALGEGISLKLQGRGGYNFDTDRPDGNSYHYGADATLDFTLSKSLGGFVFGWWEHDNYNIDLIRFHPDSVDNGPVTSRADNLYEAGAGLVWEFAPRWTLRPEILYIHDDSNVFVHNYSSTEAWVNVRFRF
jgi:tetratricopeptide (TPR) repeat protein